MKERFRLRAEVLELTVFQNLKLRGERGIRHRRAVRIGSVVRREIRRRIFPIDGQLGSGDVFMQRLFRADVEGRAVMNVVFVNAGQQEIPVKVNQLPAGRYVVTISNNKSLLHQSFVIAK